MQLLYPPVRQSFVAEATGACKVTYYEIMRYLRMQNLEWTSTFSGVTKVCPICAF